MSLSGYGAYDVWPISSATSNLTASPSGSSPSTCSPTGISSADVMSARLANRYRVGRVFLAGDASHMRSWKLALQRSPAPRTNCLDSYGQERHPISAGMLGLSVKLREDCL